MKVQIIVPGQAPGQRAGEGRVARALGRSAARRRRDPSIRADDVPLQGMIVDDAFTSVGSTNFDNRSFQLNDEVNLNVFDEPFAAEQARIFADDLARSKRYTYEEWKQPALVSEGRQLDREAVPARVLRTTASPRRDLGEAVNASRLRQPRRHACRKVGVARVISALRRLERWPPASLGAETGDDPRAQAGWRRSPRRASTSVGARLRRRARLTPVGAQVEAADRGAFQPARGRAGSAGSAHPTNSGASRWRNRSCAQRVSEAGTPTDRSPRRRLRPAPRGSRPCRSARAAPAPRSRAVSGACSSRAGSRASARIAVGCGGRHPARATRRRRRAARSARRARRTPARPRRRGGP